MSVRGSGDHVQRDRRFAVGNTDNVVMAGAHLDSVDDGPGINDNGSGFCRIARNRRADGQGESAQRRPLRLVGGRGGEPRRLHLLRQRPPCERRGWTTSPCISTSTWWRRRTTDSSSTTVTGPGSDSSVRTVPTTSRRCSSSTTPIAASVAPDRVQREIGLSGVHRQRHSRRRPVHRSGRDQDRRRGAPLGRDRRCCLRPLLPPGL